MSDEATTTIDYTQLAREIRRWGQELGFQQVGITDTQLDEAEAHLLNWIGLDRHGDMEYMARHGSKRSRPEQLVAGTQRIISVRMDYLPDKDESLDAILDDPVRAYVSRYALGRDYHKLMRNRLQKLATKIESIVGEFGYRAFVDSAPVMEKPIAAKAGLGWIGKHTNLINSTAGSWFFLGELYTDLPLPMDQPADEHCGNCTACIDVCPTRAIVAPYELDARRCISYLTIELRGAIPVEFRPLIGNRIYGCDDCQMVCPWNRFADSSSEPDFRPRKNLDTTELIRVFEWSENEFLHNTEGSAIRRIGYKCWLRNIAVALGNAQATIEVISALQKRRKDPSELVREHVEWALSRHEKGGGST
jgi:epoxyqueuosine reductase